MVIIDTDIGYDFDDALAIGLVLSSPEPKILGITAASGDTALCARWLDRLLCDIGRTDIPAAEGIEKHAPGQAAFTQARWAASAKMHATGNWRGIISTRFRGSSGAAICRLYVTHFRPRTGK
jgi:purine nucleosidase